MTATLSMVPLAQIRPSKANPRAEFDDERMAELIESVKRHGIITPLTLSRDGEGRYAIIAGERRYRAAKAAKLREVPAQVREVEGDALTLAVAENVIRADLSPLEEARAYRRLVDEHGDAAKVASSSGGASGSSASASTSCDCRSGRKTCSRARRLPLACAPALVQIAEREPLLADLAAAWLAERPQDAASFPADSGRGRGRRARGRVDGRRRAAVAPGRLQRRRLPRPDPPARRGARRHARGACSRSSARTRRRVEAAFRALPEIPHGSEYDWEAREREERRERECFALSDEDARRRARVRLPARTRRGERSRRSPLRHRSGVARGSARPEDRDARRRGGRADASEERDARPARPRGDDAEKQARREERERALRGARLCPRAKPRPRRGARALGAEARHGRREAPRLARAPALRQGGGVGAPPLRRPADDDEQAGQGDRPLPARRPGREAGPRGGARGADAHAHARGRPRGRPAPARRAAARRHGGTSRSRPPRRLRAAGAFRLEGARQARPAGRAAVGQAAARRSRGRAGRARARHGGPSRRRGSRSSARSSQQAKQSAANAVYA